MKKNKLVTRTVGKEICFEDTIDSLIEKLQTLKNEGFTNIEKGYMYEDSYFEVVRYTEETDEEYDARIAKELKYKADAKKEAKAAKEECDRRNWARLKKKFGN